MNTPSILIVEDEVIVASDLAAKLGDFGYEIAGTTETAEEAIVLARKLRPSLVLMDIHLAGPMGGIEAAAVIRRECSLPVVFLTAHFDTATLKSAGVADASGYVLKPFADRELQTQIEMALYKHASDRRLRENEERLRLAMKAAYDVIWDWDIIRDSERCNEAGAAVFDRVQGVEYPEATAWWMERIHPEDRERVTTALQAAVDDSSQTHWEDEYRFLKKDGSYASVLDRGDIMRNEQGRAVRMVGATLDLTERKQAEHQLRQLHALTDALQANAPVGIGFVSRDFRFVRVNDSLAAINGQPAAAHIGRPVSEIIPALWPILEPLFLRVLSGETIRDFAVSGETASSPGETRHWLGSYYPVRVGDEIIGIGKVILENTAQTHAEAALRESEKRLRTLGDNVPGGAIYQLVRYPDGRLGASYVSAGIEKLLGISAERVMSDPEAFMQLVVEEDRPRVAAAEEQSAREMSLFDCEFRQRTTTGGVKWVHARSMPRRLEDGSTLWDGVVVDITEHKRAEQALAQFNATLEQQVTERTLSLRQSEAHLKVAQEIAQLGNFEFDLQTARLTWSEELYRIFGFEVGGTVTMEMYQNSLAPADHARVMAAVLQATQTGEPYHIEHSICLADGSRKEVFCIGHPIMREDGQIRAIFGTVQDITKRKQTERALAELNRQLIDASRQAGMAEVATGVLHNVGNVLNSVNISTTLLLERVRQSRHESVADLARFINEHHAQLGDFFQSDPRGRLLPEILTALSEHLSTEQTEHLRELEGLAQSVGHLKQIVAMQQSYASLSGAIETAAIEDLVEDALRLESAALAKRKVRIQRAFEPVPLVVVNRHKVVQILVNLLRNATRALAVRDERERRLVLGISRSDEGPIIVRVEDNGEGIAPADLPRIFSFGYTTRPDGHGFGLHHAANAAKEMGGELSVQSTGPGEGAVFTLRLPHASA